MLGKQTPFCLRDNLFTNMMTGNGHCREKQLMTSDRTLGAGGGLKNTSSSRSDLSLCRDGTKTPFPTGHFPQSELAYWHPANPATARWCNPQPTHIEKTKTSKNLQRSWSWICLLQRHAHWVHTVFWLTPTDFSSFFFHIFPLRNFRGDIRHSIQLRQMASEVLVLKPQVRFKRILEGVIIRCGCCCF